MTVHDSAVATCPHDHQAPHGAMGWLSLPFLLSLTLTMCMCIDFTH